MEYKLKKRKNGISRIPITQEQSERGYCLGKEIRFILQQEYPEIYECFVKYRGLDIIDSNKYGFLKEVLYENNVVGFAIYNRKGIEEHKEFPNLITLDLIYILPEFRGKGVMYDEIKDIMSLHPNWAFSIDCPNYHIIKSLIKNSYAVKLNEDIVFLGDTPISAQINGDTYLYPLYDLRIKCGVNLAIPSLTSPCDRDIIDGFLAPMHHVLLFEQYDSPLDYFKEVFDVVADFNKNFKGDV